MTNKELLIQFLHEATNESKAALNLKALALMRDLEKMKPGSSAGFEQQIRPEDEEVILHNMRQQQLAIVNWFYRQVEDAMRG